jgi:hypothetical protein
LIREIRVIVVQPVPTRLGGTTRHLRAMPVPFAVNS